ncbi:MAG: MFS transporter [Pseudomonadota bacterium]
MENENTVKKSNFADMVLDYFKGFKVLKDTGREYWGIQIINFLDCTAYFAMLSISSIFLSEEIGMDDKAAGYAITVFTTATTLFLFISGTVTDWLGIRKSLYLTMIGNFITRLAVVLLAMGPAFEGRGFAVTIALLLQAPFMAGIQTIFQTSNKRYTSKKSRSAGFSLWYLFMNVGAAAGGFSIDIIRKGLGLANTHIYTMSAGLAIICLILGLIMIRTNEAYEKEEETELEKEKAKEKKNPWQIAKEVITHRVFWRFVIIISLLLGVRAVFSYMYLLFPKFWLRIIGENASIGFYQGLNPILIIIGLILFIPFANRYNVFKMLVFGAMISSACLFVIAIPYSWLGMSLPSATHLLVIISIIVLSIGEIIWSPKYYEFVGAIAPKGQEGTYLGFSQIPWFGAKTVVSFFSGHMLIKWCPEGIAEKIVNNEVSFWNTPNAMWLILGTIAIVGVLACLVFKGWLTRGVDYEAKEPKKEAEV